MKVQQTTPIFRSFDEKKAKEFYVEFLGCKVAFEHRFSEEAPLYFGVLFDKGFELHLSEHHGDSTPGSTLRIEIENIEAFHAELTSKSYRFARPEIEQQPWGFREVKLTDPFGNKLVVCQPDQSLLETRKKRDT